jgi:plastocyanin
MISISKISGHSRRNVALAVVALLLLASALLVLGCGSSTTGTTAGGQATTTAGPGTSSASGGAQVTLQNFAFSPTSVTVKVGDTVTWTNKDSTGHTVTADDGTTFTSPTMATGATFSFTFTKAGTYAYHCSIHPSMTGTIVVQ